MLACAVARARARSIAAYTERMLDRPPRGWWWDWTNVRTPSRSVHRWARLMLALCVALVVAGALIGGTASGILIVGSVIPLLVWAYLERGTAPPGSGGYG
jgi:hypothetical protein